MEENTSLENVRTSNTRLRPVDERILKGLTVIVSNGRDGRNCNSFYETSGLISSEDWRTGDIVIQLKACQGGLQRRSHGLGVRVLSEDIKSRREGGHKSLET